MTTVCATAEIEAPAAQLFALSQDYGARLRWDPFVRRMAFIGATEAARDVRAHVVASNGLAMEVRYTVFDPPRHVAVTMTRGPWLFGAFAGAWTFRDGGQGRTRIEFRYHFALRWPWLHALLGGLVARHLRAVMHARVGALAAHAGRAEREALSAQARSPR
jgi:ribosome-associated toxin RatA of RatAB toxin-antitoxin module